MSLANVAVGELVVLRSFPADPSLQDRLRAMGVKPGVALQVVRRGFPGGILHVRVGLLEFMLRRRDAAQMEIAPITA
ncbi:ferrous iron transport protein A [Synechococcus sp. Tobar12-5m-g]|jgi:ferrous iron transport protein A|uniref:FeoA family protein n=1 Tax=unclassified Synechococcus TaxID=2626047 RepID=UPI0020CE6621|nr:MULTISPECIES: FeoA family protein [unclassified Synechococcus]MCP9772959.1 ferrous iron transport protein A [Synechococcus sp. Tobar12-5m-g]MCP9873728.1 ferrous iron transport protein A [Synechococcus sp. Cruz CV-v-12]